MGCIFSKQVQHVSPIPSAATTESDDDLNKTSDFESFIIPFEGDSDEVTVTPTEEDYPNRRPNLFDNKQAEKIQWFSNWNPLSENGSSDADLEIVDKVKLDSHAKKAPKTVFNKYEQLIEYLEKPVSGIPSRDEHLVRMLLVWLSNQVVEDYTSMEGTHDTPIGYLSLLGQRRSTYSTFFTILCRKANIQCAQIHGVCKAGHYQPGDTNFEEYGCRWNAVYVNNAWQIIHPYWVCRSVFGQRAGGWIKLEEGGKSMTKRQTAAAGVIKNAFQEYYIMPYPAQFIYRCHPDDPKWQLIQTPISRKRFLEQANLLPPIWGLGIKLVTENACALVSNGNPITITFDIPKTTANEINMDYTLLYKADNSETLNVDMLLPSNLPRLVSKVRNGSYFDFHIQFPLEGVYRIVFYAAPAGQTFLRLSEFKISCIKKTPNCKLTPFNPGLMGFGPGPKSEIVGLLLPSHRNGIVSAEKNKETKMNFLLDSELSKSLEVDMNIVDSDSIDESHAIKWEVVKKTELKISFILSKDGDFGLQIFTGSRLHPGDRNVQMQVVCNYLLTTTSKFVREKANQRNARRNLLNCIESADIAHIEELQQLIGRCKKERITESDSDIENAQQKLDVLVLKREVRDAIRRRHLGTTIRTIQTIKESSYYRIFIDSVNHLQDFASQLESLEGFTQTLPSIREAIGEFTHTTIKNEMVMNTIIALSVLVGLKTRSVDYLDEHEIQTVTKDVIPKLEYIEHNTSSLKPEDARRAQAVIGKYSYKQTRNANVMAASIHDWVSKVSSTMIKDNQNDDEQENSSDQQE